MKKQNLVTTQRCKTKNSAYIANLCDAEFFALRLDSFSAFIFSRLVIVR